MGRRVRPLADRFWSKVEKTESCWLWTASLDKDGYGQIGGELNGKRTMRKAHQVALELTDVPRPDGATSALHKCNNRRCVRPDATHVYWGDHAQNMKDTRAAGSQAGANNPHAKISFEAVQAIRDLRASGAILRHIAERFNISEGHVCNIARGKTRVHA